MITRIWTASTTKENQHKYIEHFRAHVLPVLQQLGGYAGATLNTRSTGTDVEIVVITRWTSMQALLAFAGPDVDQAVVAPEAAQVLTTWDPRARNYETIVEDVAPPLD